MTTDPRTQKNLATLTVKAASAAVAFIEAVNAALEPHGVAAKIISGSRTYAEQDALYAQGRTKLGKKVTNAPGGYSWHNFGIAWDIGLFRGGVYLPESPLYHTAGVLGRKQGLEWGGDWKTFRDEPHFQIKTGKTLAQMRAAHQSLTA